MKTTRLFIAFAIGLLIGCGNPPPADKSEPESDVAVDSIMTVKARFVGFEFGDTEHYTFEDEGGNALYFDRSRSNDYEFAMELPESEVSMENQGWGPNKQLLGKWFILSYLIAQEQLYIDGPVGDVLIISGAKMLDNQVEEVKVPPTPEPLTVLYDDLDYKPDGFNHMGSKNPAGTVEIVAEESGGGGGNHIVFIKTDTSSFEIPDLNVSYIEVIWPNSGNYVALHMIDNYADAGSMGIVIVDVTTGRFIKVPREEFLRFPGDFPGRDKIEIFNIGWISPTSLVALGQVNFLGDSGHPGIDENRKSELGDNFGRNNPIRSANIEIKIIPDHGFYFEPVAYENPTTKSVSEFPRLVNLQESKNEIVSRINGLILDRFMISGFTEADMAESNWDMVHFFSEIERNVAYIRFSGTFMGAYLNEISEEIFFDITTGEALDEVVLPFHAFFTEDDYANFIEEYWMEGITRAFEEAIECAEGMEPYCAKNRIDNFSFTDTGVHLNSSMDCYPHAAAACTPDYHVSLDYDALSTFLNNFGQKVILDDQYYQIQGIDRFLYHAKNQAAIQTNTWTLDNLTAE